MACRRFGYEGVIDLRLELPPTLASAIEARNVVGDTLSDHGYEGDVEAVMLLVSELVTNSAVHAGTDIVVSMFFDRQHVSVAVHDDTAVPPITREPSTVCDVGGIGLRVVDGLSDAWGWYADLGGGKSVWCTLTADGVEAVE